MCTNEELEGLNSCSNWLNIREDVAYLNPLILECHTTSKGVAP